MANSKTSLVHILANPTQFAKFSAQLLPIATAFAILCGVLGLFGAFFVAPADYQQGEVARIMYIHVPAAMLSSGIYAFMAIMSASFLIWRHSVADLLARESAPIGVTFTLITLITGMLWGKPTWGAYWVWDARLTSVLILQLLYLGYLGVANAGGYEERTKVATAWLAVIGAINLPIIKFSVEWWNSLHQTTSLFKAGKSGIDSSMSMPLYMMLVAFSALFIALLLARVDTAMKATKLRRLQIQRIARKNAALKENLT